MGVLDDLKKEAAAVTARAEESRNTEQERREEILRQIGPKMRELYNFFKELAETLNVVQPDVRADYQVDGFGMLQGLHQEGYRLSTPDNRALTQLTFRYDCVSEGSTKFRIRGKEATERQRQYLWEHNLRFTAKILSDGDGEFSLETVVPVSFEFESDPERGAIRARVRNLNVLGATNTFYGTDQLTSEFLDELGKAVLRKPSRFNELSGNELSDDARKRLRQQLAHDGYKRLAEAQVTESEDTGEARSKKKGLFGGLLKRG